MEFILLRRFISFSATCPEELPYAQSVGVGSSALDFCCPNTLVIPTAGQTLNNVCSPCVVTAESNCDNFGKFQRKLI